MVHFSCIELIIIYHLLGRQYPEDIREQPVIRVPRCSNGAVQLVYCVMLSHCRVRVLENKRGTSGAAPCPGTAASRASAALQQQVRLG